MEIVKLARILDAKYAAITKNNINDIRRALKDAYDVYVNPRTAAKAYNIIPYLMNQGNVAARRVSSLMKDLITHLHEGPEVLFNDVNAVLAVIDELQEGNGAKIRNSIRDHWVELNKREPTNNEINMALNKWSEVIDDRLANILFKQAIQLQNITGGNEPIMGGPTSKKLREPSKEEQIRFRLTPLAVRHHLDRGDIFQKIWDDPELRPRLIRMINSSEMKNSKNAIDHKVMKEVNRILANEKRLQTNEPVLEAPEEEARQQMTVLPPEEEWSRQMQLSKQQKSEEEESAVMSPEQLDEAVRQRDEEFQRQQKAREEWQKQLQKKKEEEDLHNKYSSRTFEQLLRKYQ